MATDGVAKMSPRINPHTMLRRQLPSLYYSGMLRRVFWLLFAFWFGPSIVVPEALYQCPVHHAALVGEAGHLSHVSMSGADKSVPSHSSHKGCTCLDQGCASSPAAPPRAAWRVMATVRFIQTNAIAPAISSVGGSQADVSLPPSTGPPPQA